MAGLVFVQAAYEGTHESSQAEYVTGIKKLHGMMVDQETVLQGSKNHTGVSPLPHHLQNVQQSQPG
jgi:hypothetical protein